MATEALAMRGRPSGPGALADYWALTKPDVNLLILITTAAGFYLGLPMQAVGFPMLLLCHTLLGTLLVASGTATLNQYVEREFDAQMRRTKRRPLAAGRIEPSRVLWLGIALSFSGAIYLAVAVNLLTSLLTVLTLLAYLLLYTPLKRKTPLCTLVGAFSGAVPPLIGWAAASGSLSIKAWVLYGLVFLWQFPHFMAIAWMYREDYDRAGYLVLPRGYARVPCVVLQTTLPLIALVVIGIVQTPARHATTFCFAGTLLGLGFLYFGLKFVFTRSREAARRLLAASIIYLPLLFALSALLRNAATR